MLQLDVPLNFAAGACGNRFGHPVTVVTKTRLVTLLTGRQFKRPISVIRLALILLCLCPTLLAQTADVPMLFAGVEPAVEAMVNGKGPFLFAIDTGSSGQARVDASLAAKLALHKMGEAAASNGSDAGRRTMDIYNLAELRIGSVVFKDLAAPSRDYNREGMPHIDGILTYQLFHDYLLTLDYPAKRVRIAQGVLPAVDNQNILDLVGGERSPVVHAHSGGQTFDLRLDSGNLAGIMLPASSAAALKFTEPPHPAGKLHTVSGEIESREGRLAGSITLGRYEFRTPAVRYAEVFKVGNLGAEAQSNFAITFDAAHDRVRFERATAVIP